MCSKIIRIIGLIGLVIGSVLFAFYYNYTLLDEREFIIGRNFVFPYTTANDEKTKQDVYTLSRPMNREWILNIHNTLSYAFRLDAKVVIKLQEPAPKERFIEILMYGDSGSDKFWQL